MKILTFVDLHGHLSLLKKLIRRAKQKDIDLVVIAGDLTLFENKLSLILKLLNRIQKKVLLIQGNHEGGKRLRQLVKAHKHLVYFDKQAFKFGDFIFLGYGESGFALEDQEFRKLSRKWYSLHRKGKTILVTHGPPFGTKLDRLGKHYTGNKDLTAFIKKIKPKLVICGHLHENAGKIDQLQDTKLINPGPRGLVVEFS